MPWRARRDPATARHGRGRVPLAERYPVGRAMRVVPRFPLRTLASMFVVAGLLAVPTAGRAAAGGATPWPLGTMKVKNAIVGDCPAGFSCAKFIVQKCPLVDMDDHGQLAWSAPATSPRGVVIFF